MLACKSFDRVTYLLLVIAASELLSAGMRDLFQDDWYMAWQAFLAAKSLRMKHELWRHVLLCHNTEDGASILHSR